MRVAVMVGVITLLVLALAGCGGGGGAPAEERTIEQVIEEQTPTLLEVRGVVGTGIGECDGTPCIKVFVETATVEVENEIAPEFGGYVVVIEETGPITALELE